MISTLDIAWTAGFLEGEGSFRYQSKNGTTFYIECTQVQLEPLERMYKLFGGSIHVKREASGNLQKCHRWIINGTNAVGLAMTIYCLMSPRRKEQIKKAIVEWKSRKPRNSAKSICVAGHPFNLDNTRYYTNPKTGKIGRQCRLCKKERYGHKKTHASINLS